MSPDFLTLEDVLDMHARQLARFGGGEVTETLRRIAGVESPTGR